MVFLKLGCNGRAKAEYTQNENFKEFEKFYISRLEKHERKSLFEFIGLLRKCMSENEDEKPDFINIFLTRLKQKNNLQTLRDFIIFKEAQKGQDTNVDNDQTVQRIKELKKYERPIDDKIFQLENAIMNFDFKCCK